MTGFFGFTLGWAHVLLFAVALQRLFEMFYANMNTKRLLRDGGVEHHSDHYVYFIILHSSWLLVMFMATPPSPNISWFLLFLFILLQIGRVWVLFTLGKYWTTRIITIDAPLIKHGPYRFVRHPNYVVVLLEIPVLPLALGLPYIALFFAAANALLILYRINLEDQVLKQRRVV